MLVSIAFMESKIISCQELPTPDQIIVLCDGVTDVSLLLKIKEAHPLLCQIPDENIRTYEQARFSVEDTPLRHAIQPLHIDDRPDFIFCFKDKPILVLEMTEHAYTGDNGLQRFARAAAAAENDVPFIYFGPLRRVRDDELDSMEEGTASQRSLTSDMFQGMQRLFEIFDKYQLYIEWRTSDNGLPKKLNFRTTKNEIIELYGELLSLMGTILFCNDSNSKEILIKYQNNTARLAKEKNTRDSDVRITASPSELKNLISNPANLCSQLDNGNYFNKGKPDKLLAKLALLKSSMTLIQLPNGSSIQSNHSSFSNILAKIFSLPKFMNPSCIYYTGYKWRSDPHCGVLVSLDYRLCRKSNEKYQKDRETPLIVFYPRISCNEASSTSQMLKKIDVDSPELQDLFIKRYGKSEGISKLKKCLESKHLFSMWGNLSKQSRLFRRYADIIVLNDGLVLGNSLSEHLIS